MSDYFRFVGDVHDHTDQYLHLIKDIPYSLQVGDMSIRGYDFLIEKEVADDRHRFIGGNHENYPKIESSPHHLGNYGVWSVPEFGDIFYIRGAWSIDNKFRTPGVDWWPEEELPYVECEKALEFYKEVQPKFVVSHECPLDIVKFVTNPNFTISMGYDEPIIRTRTNQILQQMRDYHSPKIHIFGHYHQKLDIVYKEVRYICIPELGVIDFPKDHINNL